MLHSHAINLHAYYFLPFCFNLSPTPGAEWIPALYLHLSGSVKWVRVQAIKGPLDMSKGYKFEFYVGQRPRWGCYGDTPGCHAGEEFFQFCKSVINKGERASHRVQVLSSGFGWGHVHVPLTFSSGIVISRRITRYLSRQRYSIPRKCQGCDYGGSVERSRGKCDWCLHPWAQ